MTHDRRLNDEEREQVGTPRRCAGSVLATLGVIR
jgi:hypothetical protein